MYHLPVFRILQSWLTDATNGVNAQISALSANGLLVGSDPAPPTFPAGGIAEETSDPNVPVNGFPVVADSQPALAICQVDQWTGAGELNVLNGTRTIEQFPVLLAYWRKSADEAASTRDWQYTSRAIGRSLRVLMQQANENSRTSASVRIVSLDRLTALPPFQTRTGAVVTGGLILTLTVRDLKP